MANNLCWFRLQASSGAAGMANVRLCAVSSVLLSGRNGRNASLRTCLRGRARIGTCDRTVSLSRSRRRRRPSSAGSRSAPSAAPASHSPPPQTRGQPVRSHK